MVDKSYHDTHVVATKVRDVYTSVLPLTRCSLSLDALHYSGDNFFFAFVFFCGFRQGGLVIDVQGMAIGNGWFDPMNQVTTRGKKEV